MQAEYAAPSNAALEGHPRLGVGEAEGCAEGGARVGGLSVIVGAGGAVRSMVNVVEATVDTLFSLSMALVLIV